MGVPSLQRRSNYGGLSQPSNAGGSYCGMQPEEIAVRKNRKRGKWRNYEELWQGRNSLQDGGGEIRLLVYWHLKFRGAGGGGVGRCEYELPRSILCF